MTPSQTNTEKWTIGNKSEYATHNPSIIFDETGNAVADVYGVPLHATLEDVQREPRNAKALARAYLIAAAPRMLAALRAIAERDPQSSTCGPLAPTICVNRCIGCIARSAIEKAGAQ